MTKENEKENSYTVRVGSGNKEVYYAQGGGDEQYTPAYGVEILIPHIQHLKDKIIRCPFDKEDSQFVIVLKDNGFTVVNSHLEYGQDFFTYEPEKRDVIISNPPYTKREHITREHQETKQEHPAPFPEKLAEDHILSWSNEGDVILDPMAGSGTTLKMAKKNNRNYIGIEISQEYVDIANKRLQETQVGLF